MIVLDTHAWIWWASDPRQLGKAARRAVRSSRSIGVAAISCWEVAMLVEKGRIAIDRAVLEWIEQSLALPGVQLLALTPAISVRAAQLGPAFPGDPADRLIVATSLVRGPPGDERRASARAVDPADDLVSRARPERSARSTRGPDVRQLSMAGSPR